MNNLQLVSLYGDREETLASDFVQLMTVHAAKGLEFDTVFISDMNEVYFQMKEQLNESHRGVGRRKTSCVRSLLQELEINSI